MKNIILGLALTSTALFSTAQACQQEAQFIGTVTNVSADCSYKIDFSMYNVSMVCPLGIDEALMTRFKDASCTLKNGDQVSGILINLNDQIVID